MDILINLETRIFEATVKCNIPHMMIGDCCYISRVKTPMYKDSMFIVVDKCMRVTILPNNSIMNMMFELKDSLDDDKMRVFITQFNVKAKMYTEHNIKING